MVCLEPAVRPAGGVASTGPGPGCAALRVSGSRRGAPRYATSHSVSGVLVSGPGAQSFRAPPRLSGAHRGRARGGQAAGRCAVGVVWLSGAHRGRARGGQAAGRHRPGGVGCVARAPLRQARRGVPRAGQVQYHYPAERSSQRPSLSPRGAGGRAVLDPVGAHLPGQDLYHYPAERSSRRPSPRGAGGRAVRGERGGGVRSSRPASAGPVGAHLPGQAASTTTRLSGAHGGRARGGQAAGRYVAIPSGAECAFLVSAGRRAGPVVHVWPGPGRTLGVRRVRERRWAHGPSPGRIRLGRSAPPGTCGFSTASPSRGRGRKGRAGWPAPRTWSAARAGAVLGRLD